MYASGSKSSSRFSHSHASLYIGHPSASSRSLYLSKARWSGPLFRTALSGLEPAGRLCRSGILALTVLSKYQMLRCQVLSRRPECCDSRASNSWCPSSAPLSDTSFGCQVSKSRPSLQRSPRALKVKAAPYGEPRMMSLNNEADRIPTRSLETSCDLGALLSTNHRASERTLSDHRFTHRARTSHGQTIRQ